MKGDLYIKIEGIMFPVTMEIIKQIYKAKELNWEKTRNKYDNRDSECYITYGIEHESGHILEQHYGICSTTHPDGCTYCAAGFGLCMVCGAEDYDNTWIEGIGCSKRSDIIILKEQDTCTCGKKVYESLRRIRKFTNGYSKDYLFKCSYCPECNTISDDNREEYWHEGAMIKYTVNKE